MKLKYLLNLYNKIYNFQNEEQMLIFRTNYFPCSKNVFFFFLANSSFQKHPYSSSFDAFNPPIIHPRFFDTHPFCTLEGLLMKHWKPDARSLQFNQQIIKRMYFSDSNSCFIFFFFNQASISRTRLRLNEKIILYRTSFCIKFPKIISLYFNILKTKHLIFLIFSISSISPTRF